MLPVPHLPCPPFNRKLCCEYWKRIRLIALFQYPVMVTLENNLPSTTTNMTRQSTSAEGNSIDKDQTPPSRPEDLLSLQATTAPITLLFPPPRSDTCMHYTPESGWPFCLLANRCNLRNWHSKDSQYPDEAQPQQLNDSPIWTWTLLRCLAVCVCVCGCGWGVCASASLSEGSTICHTIT